MSQQTQGCSVSCGTELSPTVGDPVGLGHTRGSGHGTDFCDLQGNKALAETEAEGAVRSSRI